MAQQSDDNKMKSTQTAVEWLKNKIIDHQEKFGIPPTEKGYMNLIEQAKQMEKEQIIDAYYQCGRDNFEHIKVINRSATEYYNDTFLRT